MIGPGIVVPLVAVAVVVPAVIWYVRSLTRRQPGEAGHDPTHSATRLTSTMLHRLPNPPWRVVIEIPTDRLGDVEHVLIGPPGIYAITTALSPLPDDGSETPSAEDLAASAILRSELDDALGACALSSHAHVVVHWGRTSAAQVSAAAGYATIAVDGHRFADWSDGLEDRLAASEVDLAWQTVCLAIGRPDPLG